MDGAAVANPPRKWLAMTQGLYLDYTPDGRGFPRFVTFPGQFQPRRRFMHVHAEEFWSRVNDVARANIEQRLYSFDGGLTTTSDILEWLQNTSPDETPNPSSEGAALGSPEK
jgi:hypothetical protein